MPAAPSCFSPPTETDEGGGECRLVTVEGCWLVGVVDSGPHRSAGAWAGRLWGRARKEGDALTCTLDRSAYLCPNAARHTEFTYYIGWQSSEEVTDLPEGFVCIELPARTYAVGTQRGDWRAHDVYADLKAWMDESGLLGLTGELGIEAYPPEGARSGPALLFDAYLPVCPAEGQPGAGKSD
jgi:predicted transcriptional regulator YdeE